MRLFSIAVLCLSILGCANRITKEQFYVKSREVVNYNNSLIGTVFYQGSKNGYDYFLLVPAIGLSDQVAVKENEIPVNKMRYTRDRNLWADCSPGDVFYNDPPAESIQKDQRFVPYNLPFQRIP